MKYHQVQAFMASDGRLLATEEEAKEYEVSLLWTERIHEFSQSKGCPYPSGAQSGMMRKIIIAWESFKVTGRVL